ncbi:MAG TPA: GNAT family N-acetyltransferase [Pirellulaceae bacterium]|nr:GNAT family N-acetyltransferase [Pirellulaceae bacterium]
MSVPLIRFCQVGEEPLLREVFYSAVHGIASARYSPLQCATWAPETYDIAAWTQRIQQNKPFVAELDGALVGFADLQASGYIDQFFVAAHAAGQGIGGALMRRIFQAAESQRLTLLTSHVSLNAQPFFQRYGFEIEREQTVEIAGVSFSNARMVKMLASMLKHQPEA